MRPGQHSAKQKSIARNELGNEGNKGFPEIRTSVETLGGSDEHVAANG